ncbi:MAG TPA: hypothetical protein VK009_20495 [Chloroflexota bacterium]|jgi:hypothetical protein|nr:hypothetical protein [Chloroflexota bacterium]
MLSETACRYCERRAELMVRTIPFCTRHLEKLLTHVGGFQAIKNVSALPIQLAADKLLQPVARSTFH